MSQEEEDRVRYLECHETTKKSASRDLYQREKFRKDMCKGHKLRWKDGKKTRCMGRTEITKHQ